MAQLTNTILNGKLIVNGDIYGNLKGSATNAVTLDGKSESNLSVYSAGRLTTARTITLSGDVTGSVSFNGASNVTIETTVANAGNAITVTTSAVNSTTTYNLVGVSSSSPSNVYKTGITVSGNTINATEYTLNVGTITGNFEISGAVEDATYAVAAGKLQAGKNATNGYSIGSSTSPIYFSNGIPVKCNTTLGVSITGNAASATSAGYATQITTADGIISPLYLAAVANSGSWASQNVYSNINLYYDPKISDGTLCAPTFSGSLNGHATSATRIVTTEKTLSRSYYIPFVASSTADSNGIAVHVGGSSANNIQFNPCTGVVTAPTFSGSLTGNATSAGYAGKIVTSVSTSYGSYYIPFVASSTSESDGIDVYVGGSVDANNIQFNPSTGVVTATAFSGKATYASRIVTTEETIGTYYIPFVDSSTADSDGIAVHVGGSVDANNIQFNPYSGIVTATTFSGSLKGNASTATYASRIVTSVSTSDRPYYIPFVESYTSEPDGTAVHVCSYIKFNPNTGVFIAPTFSGTFSGNATSATRADQLTTARTITLSGDVTGSVNFDGASNVTIETTVVNAGNGNGNGNATTVTTSDVNSTTTYNLAGVSSSSPSNVYKTGITVSGNTIYGNLQGSATNAGTLGGKSESSLSVYSAGYANQIKTANASQSKLYLAAVTTSGSCTNQNVYSNINLYYNPTVGNGTLCAPTFSGTFSGNATSATSATEATSLTTADAGSSSSLPVYFSGGKPVKCDSTLNVSITGSANYATSAGYLTTSDGSPSLPVYFSGGKPVACNTTLAVSITGNAGYATNAGTLGGKSESNLSVYSATKATSLTTSSMGSASLPVYFSGGKPVACNTNAFVRASGNTAVQYIQVLTSTAYAALSSKNANVIYFITP